ncbi:MAG TPA: metallophosphoesterase family protein [Thermoanaerobaculia bacterium]|nr:metallophosphoesterase family protein [Thermoanaerobaculia bacterium]
MKALVISDIHSNLPALTAVFRAVQRKRLDVLFCLGDIVGYGAQPNQVLERIRRFRGQKLFVRGNHDRVAAGGDAAGFNHAARAAALWTRDRLTPQNRRFLGGLPQGPVSDRGVTLWHGTPADEDDYLFTPRSAREAFSRTATEVSLFGHTHLPCAFRKEGEGELEGGLVSGESALDLEVGTRYLINPGSVGQPRDRNPSAAFGILDLDRRVFRFRRVEYDVRAAQKAILAAGLPEVLAERLEGGL